MLSVVSDSVKAPQTDSPFHAFTSDNGLEPLFKPSVRSQWDKLPRVRMGTYQRSRFSAFAVCSTLVLVMLIVLAICSMTNPLDIFGGSL